MTLLINIFFVSLLFGQLGAIPITPHVIVYAHDVILFLLLFVTVVRSWKIHLWIRPKLMTPLAAFVGIAFLSLIANMTRFSFVQIVEGSLYLFRFLSYLSVYWIVVQSTHSERFWLSRLHAVGTGLSVFGFFQYLLYPDLRNLSYLGWDPHLYRLFSTLLDPNFTGLLIVLTLFVGVVLYKKRNQYWLFVFQCINLIALLLTYSRSSYLAFLTGIVAWTIGHRRWKVLTGIIFLFWVAIMVLPRPGGEGVRLERTVSTVARFVNWQQNMGLVRASPITGFGFNMLRFVHEQQSSPETTVSKAAAGVDNSFLFILLATGIVGLSVILWLLARMIQLGLGLVKRQKPLGWWYLMTLVAIGVHSLFTNSLFYPWVMIWLWVSTGVVERERYGR